MFCALVQDNKVVDRKDLTEEQIQEHSYKYQIVFVIDGLDPQPQVGWDLVGNILVNPLGDMNPKSIKITKLALINRFTNTEFGIYLANLSSSIQLQVLDKKLFAATYIDLKRADTIAGIQALAYFGLISSSRANEILTAPAKEEELYRGN